MPREEDRDFFGHQYRLKSPLRVKQVVQHRQSVYVYPIKCYYQFVVDDKPLTECQLSVIAPKRRFKRAVDRNRIKRLMREAYRVRKFHFVTPPSSYNRLLMCWMYIGDTLPTYALIVKSADAVLSKLNKIAENGQL